MLFYDSVLYTRILHKLKVFDYTIEGLQVPNLKYIENFYTSEFDFKSYKNVRIFLNIDSFYKWLEVVKNKFQIYTYINNNFSKYKSPYGYFLQASENINAIYLINNTESGTISKALGVGYYYNSENINFGYYSPDCPVEYKKLNYNIYKINELNILELVQSNIIDSINPKYELLQYINGEYASLLKIV